MKKYTLLSVLVLVTTTLFAQHGQFKLDKEYTISKTGVIDLRSSDADVFITGSERSTAHVKIQRTVESKGITWGDEEFTVEVEEENGNLVIRERQESVRVGVIGYYREEYKIQLQVPVGVSLKIQGDDGDYFIKNINGNISLDIDDADAELTDCAGSRFYINIDDGDITMDGGKGELDIDADDAEVKIRNAQFNSIRIEMDDGDIAIETSLASNGNYSINSQDGSVTLKITNGGGTFDIRHDDARVVTEGDFKSIREDENHTQVTLAGGSARINVRLDDGDIRLSSVQ